jgi:hypothetical protein
MALGVEAAGVAVRVGGAVGRVAAGQRVMTHSLPLRAQGAWAEWFVAAASDVAPVPDAVPSQVAGALPVPALTADQVLRGALGAGPGATVLVHGAGGVTGMLMVQLARHLGAEVIATAGADSAGRVAAAGAVHVLDGRSPDWPGQVRVLTADGGADLAVNAVPGGAARALGAVKDGGRLATITSDPPRAERGIGVSQVYVTPDVNCSPPGQSGSRSVPPSPWKTPPARSLASCRDLAARPWCCCRNRSDVPLRRIRIPPTSANARIRTIGAPGPGCGPASILVPPIRLKPDASTRIPGGTVTFVPPTSDTLVSMTCGAAS